MYKKVKKLVVVLLIAGILMSFGSMNIFADNNTSTEPIIFKIAHTDAPFFKVGDIELMGHGYAVMVAFKNSLEKMSSGRIKVEIYPNGQLGDVRQNIEQILSGSLTASVPSDGGLAPFCPEVQAFSIPYLFNDYVEFYDVMDGEYMQKLKDDIAQKHDIRILSSFDNGGFRNFSNSKREIKTAADLKGLKFRTMEIPAHMEMVKALGGTPTPVAWMELYNALQTGVVDGQENSPLTVIAGSLQEVQKYYSLDGHLMSVAYVVTSEKWLRSLPEDLQKIVLKAGREAEIAARGVCRANEELALNYIREKGVKIYAPTPEEMKTFEIAKEPVIKWLKENIDPKYVDGLLAEVEAVRTGKASVSDNKPAGTAAPESKVETAPKTDTNIMVYIIIGVLVVVVAAFAVIRKIK